MLFLHFTIATLLSPLFISSIGHLRGYNPTSGEIRLTRLKEFSGYRGSVFSNDGSKLAISGPAGDQAAHSKVSIVDVASLEILCSYQNRVSDNVDADSFSPDGKLLAVTYASFDPKNKQSNGTIAFVESSNCKERNVLVQEAVEFLPTVAFSSDGRFLIGQMNSVRIWEVKTGKEVYSLELPDAFRPVASFLSPNGKWLVCYGQKVETNGPIHQRLFALNIDDKRIVDLKEGLSGAVSFSDDSSQLFVGDEYRDSDASGATSKHRIQVYRVGTWELLRTFAKEGVGYSFDIALEQQILATGTADGKIRLFSLATGKQIAEEYYYKRTEYDDIRRISNWVTIVGPVEFSPNGQLLVTAGVRGTVVLWKLVL